MKSIPFEGVCEKTRRYLDAYVDNELLVETSQEVLRHLESCPECAAEADMRSTLKLRVRGAVRSQTAPPELAAEVRQRLRDPEQRHWWNLRTLSLPAWAMAAGAAAVLCAGVWFATPSEPYPAIGDRPAQARYIQRISTGLAQVLRPGLADHVHCAVFRKYPADPPPLATMLKDLGPYHDLLAAVNQVVPKSWRVVMAHQCTFQGRKFVHLTLKDGGKLISLVIVRRQPGETFDSMRPITGGERVPMFHGTSAGYNIAAFGSGEYIAYLVSDLPDTENLKVLALLEPPVTRVLTEVL